MRRVFILLCLLAVQAFGQPIEIPLSESLNNIGSASTLNGTEQYVVIQNSVGKKASTTLLATIWQPLDLDLTALAGTTGTNTIYYRGASTWLPVTIGSNLSFTGGILSAMSSGGTWGTIVGNLSDQGDLMAALNNKQPLDGDLTAIAALTTTAFGRGLLDEADATSARVTLGLVIGTDVQAPDADLTALAAATGTNTIYYRSATSTWSPVTIGANLTFASGTLSATGGGGGGGDLFAANNLSELTNKATARTNLQLVIGTDVLAPTGNGSALTGITFSQISGTTTDAQIASTIARDSEVAAAYQPLDSDLTAIAAFSTTAFGRSFLDDTDASVTRAALGLVIGTDVLSPTGNGSGLTGFTDSQIPATIARDAEVAAGYQPLDADLTAIAAITTTTFGRGLLDETDATAARVTLGLVIGTDVLAPAGNGSALTNINFTQLAGTASDAQIPAAIARDSEVAAGYQPLDGDLTALAATAGTNTLYYRSAANTWSAVTIGSNLTFSSGTLSATGGGGGGGDMFAANNLSELTNKATARSNLQLVIGTDVLAPTGSGASLTGITFTQIGGVATDAQIPAAIARDAEVAAAYQPLDTDLTSIAALTTTTFGRGLLDDADATAARVSLGLVIGTNVLAPNGDGSALTGFVDAQIPATIARDSEVAAGYQPLDSDLTSIAALTTTAFGRGLLDDASAAAARTTLGLVIGTDVLAPAGNGSALTGLNFGQLSGTTTDAQIPATIARDAEVAAGYQPLDADLTTFAGISPSANIVTFLGAATYAAMRTQLTLVPGTDIQAFDADLSSLASASGTNTIYYRSALNTWSPVTIGTNLSFAAGTLDVAGTAVATSGDSATGFFTTGQIERARGGTGSDTSAFGIGLIGSDASNNTIDIDTPLELSTALGMTPSAAIQTANPGATLWSNTGYFAYAAETTQPSGPLGGVFTTLYQNDGAALAAGDRLGGYLIGGSSSATVVSAPVAMIGFATENWSPSAQGSRLSFQNTTTGTNTRTERMAIEANNGLITFGGPNATNPALAPLGTALLVRLGDNSGYAPISASTGTFSGAVSATSFTGSGSALTGIQPLDADLTALAALSGTNLIYYRSAADTWSPVTIGTNLTFIGGTLSSAGGSGANPTASVGLTAVNGSAGTFMRSDGAPALSQSITPTWTGLHIFDDGVDIKNGNTSAGLLRIYEDSDDGANFASFSVPALAANTVYTLPPDDGDPGEFLRTNGAGVTTWESLTAAPGGADTQIQFNDGGVLGGDADFTWNKTTNTLTLPSLAVTTLNSTAFEFEGATADAFETVLTVTDPTADRTVTLPNASTIVPVYGYLATYTGFTSAHTITLPDANFSVARIDAGQTFTGLQQFTPGATVAGINVGSIAGDPSAPTNGGLWYDSTANELTARINGANVPIGTRTGVRRTVYINAGAMIPRTTNGAATGTTETTTNDIMVDSFDFDSTTEEGVGFWWTPPTTYNAGTVTVRFYWTCSAGTGNVKWDVAARAFADDDAIDQALGTEQSSGTDALLATGDMHISPTTPALTIGGTPAANRPTYFQVTRDTATDTLSADAKLMGATIEFTESSTEPSAQ